MAMLLKGVAITNNYMSIQETAEKWGISTRRIQKLCEENRINGVVRFSRVWAIPKDAKKPIDARVKINIDKK